MSGKLVLNYIICIQLCFHSEEVEGISLCEWGPAFPLGRIYFSLPSVPPVGMGRDTGDIQHLYFTVKGAAQCLSGKLLTIVLFVQYSNTNS